MTKIAVDIVLLPESAIMAKAIKLNSTLVEKFGSPIELNDQNCLPHISLAMACIDQADIPQIETVLTSIARSYPVSQLPIDRITVSTNALGQDISFFKIQLTKKLQTLHEQILTELKPFFNYDVTADMLYPSGWIAETSLDWIRNYFTNSSFDNFLPHITLGYGRLENIDAPIDFKPEKLALCHLGNHCTCRKILIAIDI